MFLDGLFGDFEGVCNFLIGPTLSKVFDHRLFSIRKLKSFFGLIRIKLLATPEFF